MITREEAKYNLNIEMLKQSFQRQGDSMTSILLGNATSTAFSFFEKHIESLEQHIKELEEENKKGFQALHCPSCQGGGCPICGGSGFVFGRNIESQLSSNPLQLTCESCVQVDCPMYLEAFNYSVVESKNDFYCNFYSPKETK